MQHAELRERVLEANLALGRAGLVVLTFGNASAVDRDAGVVAIKPSGVSYDRLTPDDDRRRRHRERRGGGRRDAALVGHAHAPRPLPRAGSTSAASCTRTRRSPPPGRRRGEEIPCYGTTHADHFDGAVPVTRPLTAAEIEGEYERATGEVIVETFARLELEPLDRPAVLVASHGPFAWGASVEEAVENAIALEEVAAGRAAHEAAARRRSRRSATTCAGGTSAASTGRRAYYGQTR